MDILGQKEGCDRASNPTMCCDRAVPLIADPINGSTKRFIRDGHGVRVGVDQRFCVDDKRHMTFPKKKIVP
tara:strand:- start:15 stop:227 length:213 start_codon:yes stop_codon:yes gene_type:complete